MNISQMSSRSRLLLLAIAAICFAMLSATSPDVSHATESPLSVLGSGTLEITGDAGSDSASARIVVDNSDANSHDVYFRFVASNPDFDSISAQGPPKGSRTITSHQVRAFTVTFKGLNGQNRKVIGELLVQTTGSPTAARTVELTPGLQPTLPWGWIITLAPLVAAGILGGRTAKDVGRSKLAFRAPGPQWKYDSWATTFTTGGAVLAAVLAGVTFPDIPREASKDTIVSLSLFYGFIALAGPFLFQTIRGKQNDPEHQEAGLWGYNWALLIACCMTLMAVLGQIATLALLSWEVLHGPWRGWVAVAISLVFFGLTVAYFERTVPKLVSTQWLPKPVDPPVAANKSIPTPAPGTSWTTPTSGWGIL